LACPRYDRRYIKFEQPEAVKRQPRAPYCIEKSAGQPPPVPPRECVIKANISSNGERIYHMPGQRYYNVTIINESKGERWFRAEDEALAAGWRKTKT
jgi:hypothetical protein